MSWLEWAMLAWIAGAALFGFRAGFVYTAGSLVGFMFSLWAARAWGPAVAGFMGDTPWGRVVASVGIVIVVTKLGGLAAGILNKIFRLTSIIPFLGLFNRVAGALLSGATHLLLSALTAFLITRILLVPLATHWWSQWMVTVGGFVAAALPAAVQQVI